MSDERHHLGGLDGVLAPSLRADAVDVFVDLAYWAVLGRPPDSGALEAAVPALRSGALSRHAAIRNLVESHEFAELLAIEEATLAALGSGAPFAPTVPFSAGMSERVVEVPWVLSRYRGERRVVDVGYANAPSVYLSLLLRLGVPELLGLDLAVRRVPSLAGVRADLRGMPYEAGSADVVLLISTLEHIGFDNSVYGGPAEATAGDQQALAEIARVLRPAGRLLVTVPIGVFQDHGWFRQYDEPAWRALVGSAPFDVTEETAYRATPDGWVASSSITDVADARYGEPGPGASAVLCAELTRRT